MTVMEKAPPSAADVPKPPPPLLRLKNVWRSYPSGDEPIHALKNINLTIESGEMVAIIGQSGSGKSTLMNILGCLDRPTKGGYRVDGRNTKKMTPNELAQLRREHFGFIFQRDHLLPDLDARGNVEVPAVYAGKGRGTRRDRAIALLGRLGLADRLTHRPNQLSGGQQQRVSVARALMNGGEVILADEPTGALDSRSGVEMMKILKELNAEGHTIILVTHDPKVAANARRIIEISDGEIVRDYQNPDAGPAPEQAALHISTAPESWAAVFDRVGEALRMALISMNAHKLRTLLTMLGIIIGIAAVVTILALIGGAQKSVLAGVGSMGSDAITVMPGGGVGDERSVSIRGFRASDVQALQQQTYVDSVTPVINTGRTLRVGNITGRARIEGVGEEYFRVNNTKFDMGQPFKPVDVQRAAQVVVIDHNTAEKMFPQDANPVGNSLLIGNVPAQVVGVTAKATGLQGMAMGDSLGIYVPYTTVMTRMDRRADIQQISIKVKEGVPHAAAEKALVQLLKARRGRQDFFVITPEAFRAQLQQITLIFSVLFGVIGGISLLVGGIGVMNIMLVSVSERTKEIGVRTAVGARQSDILSQFIIEAVLVCLLGGVLGVLLSMLAGAIFGIFVKDFQLVYSPMVMFAAFAVSTFIGVAFGYLPARNAAVLDPVDALARE